MYECVDFGEVEWDGEDRNEAASKVLMDIVLYSSDRINILINDELWCYERGRIWKAPNNTRHLSETYKVLRYSVNGEYIGCR